jgi:transposase
MDVHKNAGLTPRGRAELVRRVTEGGQSRRAVAAALRTSIKTVGKWVSRFRAEGPAGREDRPSRTHRLRAPTSEASLTCP